MSQENVPKLIYRMLKMYDIQITYPTVNQTMRLHPTYPSIQSISDALDSLKVKHVVVKVSLEKLHGFGIQVITYLKKGDYIQITHITDSKVYYKNASGREKNETRDSFEKQWSGIALAIEDTTNAREPDYMNKQFKEIKENLFRYGIVVSCIALLIVLTFFSWANDSSLTLFPKILLVFANTIGCYLSYAIILKERKQKNRLIQKFCRAGKHIDCNQVTKSRYSKLFGLISWAEIGMAYFIAITIWVALAPLGDDWLSPLWWFILAPLPFTVWSLFTQAFLIRKWCLFCCITVFLLWINACVLYVFFPIPNTLPIVETTLLALLFLVCTIAILFVSQNSFEDKYLEKRETARIKYDWQTIQCHLSESCKETGHTGFVWGNSQSTQEINLYVSIACSHCGSAIKELRRLIDIYPDFCYRLIFAVRTDNLEHKSTIIVRHFASLYHTMNQNEFFDMLETWYAMPKKTLEELQKVFPVSSPEQENKAEMDTLYQFTQQAKISYTPAILINRRLLSQMYSWQDLFGIVRSLNAEEK